MIEILVYRNGKVVENIQADAIPKLLKEEHIFLWVDLDKPTETDEQILSDVFQFHPLTIEDCRINHNAPKIEEFPDYLYFVMHGVSADTSSENFNTKELDGYLGKNFVVTYHHEPFRSIDEVKRLIRSSPVACQRGASYVLHQILDQLVDFYSPVIDDFDSAIAEIEDRILRKKTANDKILEEIMYLKRNVVRLKRISARQLEILYRMSHGEFAQIEDSMLPFYRDIYDHLLRISDLAESYREMISGLLEAHFSVIATKTNDVMKLLAVFSAIMLPLTLIAGIYGMNFDNMPELHSKYGYFATLGLMAIVAIILLIYFWRRGWIGESMNEERNETVKLKKSALKKSAK